MEHEVIDDELTAAGKQIRQRLRTIRPLERVGLRDDLPWKVALQSAQLVALASERLLFL
jgi:hypothetical protein